MAYFPLLLDATAYEPNTFPYRCSSASDGKPGLEDWIEVFRKSIPSFVKQASFDTSVPAEYRQRKSEQFAEEFCSLLDTMLSPSYADPVNCIALCAARDACLRRAGFGDIFKFVKDKENGTALQLLPDILHELDSVQLARTRWELATRGVFAGNLFDLGAAASAARYDSGDASFPTTRTKLLPRPWAIDDMDLFLDRMCSRQPYRKAIMFVDNAGSDIMLGMLPFAREMLKLGTTVVLAANETPTINDITAEELRPLIQAAGELDDILRVATEQGRLRVVSSGNPLPVIDLRQVSHELYEEALDADLVILEGMGRGIETNLHANFACDSIKLGMIKHAEVASMLGGRLYDCVCKYTLQSR